jgi:hypothetical protein
MALVFASRDFVFPSAPRRAAASSVRDGGRARLGAELHGAGAVWCGGERGGVVVIKRRCVLPFPTNGFQLDETIVNSQLLHAPFFRARGHDLRGPGRLRGRPGAFVPPSYSRVVHLETSQGLRKTSHRAPLSAVRL